MHVEALNSRSQADKKLKANWSLLHKIADRALYYSSQMIVQANNRKDKEKGDPKVGGHTSACASYLHIAAALHLQVKTNFDWMAVKPHAAPMDHTMHYMLRLLIDKQNEPLSDEDAKTAMMGLRKFSHNGEPVFQSYHSAYDPDNHNFLPSGTVGIPPVQLGYLAHAYRMAEDNGEFEVPKAHFWAVMGDAEYREGSLQEALPDFAERELGNLTWIVDYNRQSLDGHRITNKKIMNGTDNERIARTAIASGWEVIQVRHGKLRLKTFAMSGGETLRIYLEDELEDYEFQALLLTKDIGALREQMLSDNPKLKEILGQLDDEQLKAVLRDLGGHDIEELSKALEISKDNPRRPSLIIAHTLKGWGLEQAGTQGNHSSLPSNKEIDMLREKNNVPKEDLFQRFAEDSEEGQFLKARGEKLLQDIREQHAIRDRNIAKFQKTLQDLGEIPDSVDVNYKMASYPHTQWMLGQITAKLNRIANTPLNETELKEKQKPLSDFEKAWKTASELIISMAPDVGTSTNLNPSMDGQIYDPDVVEDYEKKLQVKDHKVPDLVPSEDKAHRFIRFEIEESNTTSCCGSYGQMRDQLGIPYLPLMTIYDFFVKRALDQHFYNLYWNSSFIMIGTPSGVTLSPEGAQHGWKSDIQIPNQITWEPFFCQELDWILSDAIRRHMLFDNNGRGGVHIRTVTRGVEQKDMLKLLRRQKRFKSQEALLHADGFVMSGASNEKEIAPFADEDIFRALREEVLAGAYYLIDYRGYAGYEPGDNVVNLFAMGSLCTEAIKASEELLTRGIYANVIVVTSPDLLLGIPAHENNYQYLREVLQVDARLHLHNSELQSSGELLALAARQIPVVSVHDGEPGLLDNIGSILGVRQIALACRKHSKCGRPAEVYAYHNIDAKAVVEATGQVLSETAITNIRISAPLLQQATSGSAPQPQHWKELWPNKKDIL